LHLDLFEQPGENGFCSSLLGARGSLFCGAAAWRFKVLRFKVLRFKP
jgi:hypothetical protein